nr:MAG TPA: hypothetical protein [Caudoviricetes sp.]
MIITSFYFYNFLLKNLVYQVAIYQISYQMVTI